MPNSERKFVFIFVAIAFIYSWIIWLPCLLESFGIVNTTIPNSVLITLGAFGPTVSSFILTFKGEGRRGVKELIKNAAKFNVGAIWYLVSFLLLPTMFLIAFYTNSFIAGKVQQAQIINQPWMVILYFIYMFLLGGSLQEEFGWRGYLLIKLQNRWNALVSSLILGVNWALWHLPLFFIAGTGQSYIPFGGFFISTISLSILFTWLFNNTRGSIFISLIFHTMFNLSFSIFPLFEIKHGGNYSAYLYFCIVITIVASIVVFVFGPSRLSKKTV